MRMIDADALMKVIREHDYPLRSHFNSTDNGMFTIGVQQAVDEAPTIDAVPVVNVRHGRPIKFYSDPYTGKLFTTCSECDGKISPKDRFCKHCGAKMEDKT